MNHLLAATLIATLTSSVAFAQLPPGHAPTGNTLPPGHAPTGINLPPGHAPLGAAGDTIKVVPTEVPFGGSETAPPSHSQYGIPTGDSASSPAPAAIDPMTLPNEGTVVTTLNAGGYTYIEVTSKNGNIWLAVPQTRVNEGDKIRFEDGAQMVNFPSRSLGRTFPTISFISGVAVVEAKK